MAAVHLIAGELQLNGETLKPGDGAKLEKLSNIAFKSQANVQALVFDLP